MTLINFEGLEPFANLIDKIYGDAAQPGVQQVGLAISGILCLVPALFWCLALGKAQGKTILEDNFQAYRARIKGVPADQIAPVPAEVGVPILERLSYVSNKELRDLYIELLAKASIKDTNSLAHPKFAIVLNSISPDEAILIKTFASKVGYAYVEPRLRYPNRKSTRQIVPFYTEFEGKDIFLYKENISAYFSNLISLGLVEKLDLPLKNKRLYEDLKSSFEQEFQRLINSSDEDSIKKLLKDDDYKIYYEEGKLHITHLGNLFLKAVLPPDESLVSALDLDD